MNKTIEILVIEDVKIAQKVAKLTMESIPNCKVDIAKNSNSGINFMNKKKYDLIFIDPGQPDISGFNVSKMIRQGRFKLNKKNTPIICLSSNSSEQYKAKCIELGMDIIETKPITIQKTIDIINLFMGKKWKN